MLPIRLVAMFGYLLFLVDCGVAYGSAGLAGASMNSRGITRLLFSPGCSGTVTSGVTITINSVLFRSVSLVLNRFPRMGMLARPGIFKTVSVKRWSIRPAITKL